MLRPLEFHEKARRVVEAIGKKTKGSVKIVGIRQVNVVAHAAVRAGRPTRWSGFAARRGLPDASSLAVPMQSRSAVVISGERPCTMLVFNETDPDTGVSRPASSIVAGASAVPSAIEAILSQRSRHPNELTGVFNSVITGRIEAPGLTLEGLQAHSQSIVTKKFPGVCYAPPGAQS